MSRLTDLARRATGLARPASRARRRGPALSVVVPVYDVERYLPACLDSVLTQPFADLEVVVVDDGSPDRSGEIAEEYAARDPRVRVVHQDNAGLGAARNAGVAHARGEYLAFLDSDDVLPADAYGPMLATLRRTGSDFAVGAVDRLQGERRWRLPLMRRNHQADRLGATVATRPLILADVFAHNKVFRRAFWEAAGLAFPEGVRYEDQPAMTRAFVSARTFDVLAQTVYLWRVRDDDSSITQRRFELADLQDRILTKRMSTELVTDQPDHVRRVWYAEVLPVDMWEYFRSVPGCSEEYWTTLRDGVREFWNDATVPFEQTLVPVQQRLMGWYVATDRRADLERLLVFLDSHEGGAAGVPTEDRDGRRVRLMPGHDDPSIPRGCYELADHETR